MTLEVRRRRGEQLPISAIFDTSTLYQNKVTSYASGVLHSTMAAETKTIDYSVLKDRSIIVTGGASGLGEAIVTRLAPYGAHITIADMQE